MYLILSVGLVLGVFLVGVGVFEWMNYSSGSSDSTGSITTGITIGWLPQNPTSSIRLYIQPEAASNGSNSITFDLHETVPANTTFYFNFISPFRISRLYFLGINEGNWSYRNSKDGFGSVVRFNDSVSPRERSWTMEGVASFYFTNLPERVDHGTYTVYLAFGGSVPLNLQSEFGPPSLFGIGAGNNFEMDFDIPFTYPVSNSFPQYFAAPPVLTGMTNNSMRSLRFILNDTTSVSITYENPSEVSRFALAQNLEFFCLGLGTPFVITSAVEILKTRAEEEDRKATRANHSSLAGPVAR